MKLLNLLYAPVNLFVSIIVISYLLSCLFVGWITSFVLPFYFNDTAVTKKKKKKSNMIVFT